MKIKNLHHICIQTTKYKESLEFYTKILGFEVIKETPNFHHRDFNSWLKLDSIMIELQTAKQGEKLNRWTSLNEGPVHLCFVVEDVFREYKIVKERRYTDFKNKNGKEIYKVENGYLFKVKAPEGTEIEIRDNPRI